MPTLIFAPRYTEDSQQLWQAAMRLGWSIERLHGWHVPEHLRAADEPVLYIDGLMGPMIAEQLGLTLPEPPQDWLPRLPAEYRRRDVRLTTLGMARGLLPAFVKPPNDKSFSARVYTPGELPDHIDDEVPVLVVEPVVWEREFRCFVLDRQMRTCSVYLRQGELQRAHDFATSAEELSEIKRFADSVLRDTRVDLPYACALDVGVIAERGWAVVEINAAWGSGIYGCDAAEVLEVLRHTARPLVPTAIDKL
jgi:hypothetical protein